MGKQSEQNQRRELCTTRTNVDVALLVEDEVGSARWLGNRRGGRGQVQDVSAGRAPHAGHSVRWSRPGRQSHQNKNVPSSCRVVASIPICAGRRLEPDGGGAWAPAVAKPIVGAEVRHFPAAEKEQALAWLEAGR